HGIAVGVEVGGLPSLWEMAYGSAQAALGKKPDRNPLIPRVQATLIIPGGAAHADAILSVFRLIATVADAPAAQETLAGRAMLFPETGEVHWVAWVEGPHVVITVGTETRVAVAARINGPEPRLDRNPLFQRVQEFDQFRTDVRGFVDVRSLAGLARRALMLFDAPTARKVEALGL